MKKIICILSFLLATSCTLTESPLYDLTSVDNDRDAFLIKVVRTSIYIQGGSILQLGGKITLDGLSLKGEGAFALLTHATFSHTEGRDIGVYKGTIDGAEATLVIQTSDGKIGLATLNSGPGRPPLSENIILLPYY